MNQYWLISCYKYKKLMQDIPNRGTGLRGD